MKVIAQTNMDSFNITYLVEITEREIKQILGDYYSEKKIKIGTEIVVSNIYDKYKSMTANKKKLKEIRDQANSILSSIEKIAPIVAPHVEKDN